jgi:hypothetical protein
MDFHRPGGSLQELLRMLAADSFARAFQDLESKGWTPIAYAFPACSFPGDT